MRFPKYKVILVSLFTFISCLSAQTCQYCPPSEPITIDSLAHIAQTPGRGGYFHDISFAPNSQHVAIIWSGNRENVPILASILSREQIIDIESDLPHEIEMFAYQNTILSNEMLNEIAWSSDGETIALGDQTGQLTFWDVETLDQIGVSNGQSSIREIIYHPTANSVLALEGYNTLAWHALDRDPIYLNESWNDDAMISHISLSEDGEWIAIAKSDNVFILDADTGEQVAGITVSHNNPIILLYNSQLLVSSDVVELWDWLPETENLIYRATFPEIREGNQLPITHSVINIAGDLLITVNGASCIRAWDIKMQMEIKVPAFEEYSSSRECDQPVDYSVQSMALSPDNLWLMFDYVGLRTWIVPENID